MMEVIGKLHPAWVFKRKFYFLLPRGMEFKAPKVTSAWKPDTFVLRFDRT